MNKACMAATALALLWLPAGALATANGADWAQRAAASGDAGSARPEMARGTDLRPCRPGTHSEFSRLTGGYYCLRNP